jgi:hypothetical protein
MRSLFFYTRSLLTLVRTSVQDHWLSLAKIRSLKPHKGNGGRVRPGAPPRNNGRTPQHDQFVSRLDVQPSIFGSVLAGNLFLLYCSGVCGCVLQPRGGGKERARGWSETGQKARGRGAERRETKYQRVCVCAHAQLRQSRSSMFEYVYVHVCADVYVRHGRDGQGSQV